MAPTWLPVLVSLGVAGIAGELLRRFALRRQLVDRPNERSLHKQPVPRMGGIALVLGVAVSMFVAAPTDGVRTMLVLATIVAVLGGVDDVRPLTPAVRFPIHLASAVAFVVFCGPATAPFIPATVTIVLTVIGLAGLLNIYNFMDGMDGLAGFQTLAAGAVQAVVFHQAGFEEGAVVGACIAGAAVGFLLYNFPPARMFMGDAGATALGYTFAALAVLGSQHGVPVTVGLLPLGPFLLDGTFTIFRRVLHKEKPWKAHRSHLYQRAVQAGLTHRQVLAVYVAWLAVCACGAFVEKRLALAGWALAVTALGGVILWVRRLEATASERVNSA